MLTALASIFVLALEYASGGLKRRGRVSRSKYNEKNEDLAPAISPRPRSVVLSRSPSPSKGNPSSAQSPPVPPRRIRLHLSDGSDSDAVTNGAHVESEWMIRQGGVWLGSSVCFRCLLVSWPGGQVQ